MAERIFLNLKMEHGWQSQYANHAEAKADITDCTHDLGREHAGRCP